MPRSPELSPVEKISPSHNTTGFDCAPAEAAEAELKGYSGLNEFLKRYALVNARRGSSQTYVVHRRGAVVGYYSIAPGSVQKAEAPERIGRGLANYQIGVILLARLAVHNDEHGGGLGAALLKDALVRIERAADIVSGRATLVHAMNATARAFWEKYGFQRSPLDEFQLMLLMKDVRAALREGRR